MTPTLAHPAPRSIDELLSPDWLSAALARPVSAVQVVDSSSSVATKIRLRVTPGDGEPFPLFCKALTGPGPISAFHARITRTEARFYTDLIQHVHIKRPAIHYVGLDEESGRGTFIMDDLTATGARFLGALDKVTQDEVRSSLDQLARLHTPFWGGAGLDQHTWIGTQVADFATSPLLPREVVADLVRDGRTDGLPDSVRDVDRIHASLQALAQWAEVHPETLVHGDVHAGNIYEHDGEVGLTDFQLLQRTHWAVDVAYHLGAVLAIDDRRSWEQDLVRHYLERLRVHGVPDVPGFDAAFAAYRRGMVYGYYLWSNTRTVDRAVIVELSQRLGTALGDLESMGALGV